MGSGRDADPCQRQLLGPSVLAKVDCSSAHRRGASPTACFQHRAPSLNGVVPQHPPPSHRLWWAERNVAVGPDGDPLRVHSRRVGLEVTELLLLLGVQPPLTTSLFWRLIWSPLSPHLKKRSPRQGRWYFRKLQSDEPSIQWFFRFKHWALSKKADSLSWRTGSHLSVFGRALDPVASPEAAQTYLP